MENIRTCNLLDTLPDSSKIWNVCVVAHVDHGKTSLTDAMLASNNIISKKMTGLLRYLDFREDEQEREITMKSSAVSLLSSISPDSEYYKPLKNNDNNNTDIDPNTNAIINVIDSPGHIDFTFEVSSGLQLCDGALVVVDVVEGIAPQTVNLMKKVVDEGIRATLVLNKLDKLIGLLSFQPASLHYQVSAIIEAANASMNIFIRSRIQALINENPELNEDELFNSMNGQEYFSAQKDNVLFCSVVDGWGFRLKDMARIFAPKWKIDEVLLKKYIWGDFYFDPSTKKIVLKPPSEESQPIFVQFIIGSIYKIYQAIKENDKKKIQIICKTFDIPLPNMDSNMNKDGQVFLSQFMHSWLPIEKSLFAMITEKLPTAKAAQIKRIDNIVTNRNECKKIPEEIKKTMECIKQDNKSNIKLTFSENDEQSTNLINLDQPENEQLKSKNKNDIENESFWTGSIEDSLQTIRENIQNSNHKCSPIAIISKYLPIKSDTLRSVANDLTIPHLQTVFIGFSRLFCGIIKKGDELLLRSKKNEIGKIKVKFLFLFLGQQLIPVDAVYPGNIFGFWDPNLKTYKSGCIISNPELKLLRDSNEQTLIQVRLQTKNLSENESLINGLKILNCVDPVCEIFNDEKGQLILSVNGEIHLERCIFDLEKDYAKVKVFVSEIIVNFRETVDHQKLTVEKTKVLASTAAQDILDDQEEEALVQEALQKMKTEEEEKNEEMPDEDDLKKEYLEDSRFIFRENTYRLNRLKNMPKKIFRKPKNIKIQKFNMIDNQKESKNYVYLDSSNQKLSVLVQCLGLPIEVTNFLNDSQKLIKEMIFGTHLSSYTSQGFFDHFFALLDIHCKTSYRVLIKKHLQCFGPKFSGPNLLLNFLLSPEQTIMAKFNYKVNFTEKELIKYALICKKMGVNVYVGSSINAISVDVSNSFDNITLHGPLCEEEVFGCCFILEQFIINQTSDVSNNTKVKTCAKSNNFSEKEEEQKSADQNPTKFDVLEFEKSPKKMIQSENISLNLSSEEIQSLNIQKTVKDACFKSFLGASPKVMQGMFEVNAYCRPQNETQFCEIIKKKNGRITNIEFQNEVNLAQVQGLIPIHESFGFYSDVLTGTSGRVVPQLKFAGWETIKENPFLEEILTDEHVTQHGDTKLKNYAKELVRKIRIRKGILTDMKIVEDDMKQATMSRTR